MLRRRCGLIAAKPRLAVERTAVGRAAAGRAEVVRAEVARAEVARALPRTFERAEVLAAPAVLLRAEVVRLRRAVGLDLRLVAEEFKVRLAINLIPPAADLQQLPYQLAR